MLPDSGLPPITVHPPAGKSRLREGDREKARGGSTSPPTYPSAISQSQITIGIGVSRNTETAEAIVDLEITAQLDLKMRSREAQSSSLGLTDRTTLKAVSSPGRLLDAVPSFGLRSAFCHVPSNQNYKPRVKRGQQEEVQQTWLLIDGFVGTPGRPASWVQTRSPAGPTRQCPGGSVIQRSARHCLRLRFELIRYSSL